MRIICDMDEVIVDMMNPLIARYNKKFSSDITIEDITQWVLPQDMRDIYEQEDFFPDLPPIPDAIEGIKRLIVMGHDVTIATNHSGNDFIAGDKVQWIRHNLPFLIDNLMIGARKDLLQGDVIIDDNADYLINSPCPIKICMDRPWNRYADFTKLKGSFYRVYNWRDILKLFEGGAFKVW